LNKDEPVTTLICCNACTKETAPRNGLAQAAKARRQDPAMVNKRLAEQTRKILGKHYASKYRVR
jgi:hypothetical protein